MDFKALISQKHTSLHQQYDNGILLTVKETAQYRWLEYGGLSIQSLMDKAAPEKIVMPVCQSLLLFLFFKEAPLNILNLGIGGASIERALAKVKDVSLTSVDASQAIIDMAKHHFMLPQKVDVICQSAELFVQQTTALYDVILCDLFTGEESPSFLFNADFYKKLSKVSTPNSVVMINLQADTDNQLLHVLLAIKAHFPHVALMDFDDYSNVVIVGSSHEIPGREILQARLAHFTQLDSTCFLNSSLEQAIEKIFYIPVTCA